MEKKNCGFYELTFNPLLKVPDVVHPPRAPLVCLQSCSQRRKQNKQKCALCISSAPGPTRLLADALQEEEGEGAPLAAHSGSQPITSQWSLPTGQSCASLALAPARTSSLPTFPVRKVHVLTQTVFHPKGNLVGLTFDTLPASVEGL